MNALVLMLMLFTAVVQDAPPLRENASRSRAHTAPANLLEVTENVAFEEESFGNVGVTLLESSRPPSGDEVNRITPFMVEVGAGLGEKFMKAMIARQKEDPTALADLTQLLRSRLYAIAHRSLSLELAAHHDVTRRDLLELVARLRAPERENESLAKLALPKDAMELEPTLTSLHPVLRCVPYVLFAALHEPSLWAKDRAAEREILISDLLHSGAEDSRVAAVVLRALDPPIDGVVTLDEEGVKTEHPFAYAKAPVPNRRVGFTEIHLEIASALFEQVVRERDAARKAGGTDPFVGARAYLPGWAEEIRGRIQRELIEQGRVAQRLDRPDDLVAIWRYRAETWPWPELVHEFERYLEDLASGKIEHPMAAELAQLEAKAMSAGLSADEEARRAELDRRLQIEIHQSTRDIVEIIGAHMPVDDALSFLDRTAARLERAYQEHSNRFLSCYELSAAWNNVYWRAPQSACERLTNSKDIAVMASPGYVAAESAIDALSSRALRPDEFTPMATDALTTFAMNAPTADLRWYGLTRAWNLTPQQAEDAFSRAIDDATGGDPRWSEEDRTRLAGGAMILAEKNAESGSVSTEWYRESILRVFQAGLWPEPGTFGDRDDRPARIARVLTDAQVAALEASGKLPAWVKTARAKPPGAK